MVAALDGLRLGAVWVRSVFRKGDVKLDRVRLDRELEAFRHHPDDRVWPAIELEGAFQHVAIAAKMLLPEVIAQHDLVAACAAARLFIRADESAT